MHASRFCILALSAAALLSLSPAQPQPRMVFNHPLNAGSGDRMPSGAYVAAPESLKVLVAMVAFQEDTDPRTTGNGSFDTSVSAKKVIDPSPHDFRYVQEHMAFAENYFRKVSNGRFTVSPTVLPDVYRVGKPMSSYSPPRSSSDNVEVGKLMQDAWHLVDSLNPGFPFGEYGAFVIMHAGAGRDIDLSAILGYDPTPYDIPSLYISLGALRKMFGSSYEGIPVSGGAFAISSSIILPETESRKVNTGLGTSLLSLGINGLIVASIGSHLGLPDLFDTKTGRSGIGRFGLMDGQSIFSWSGVFPPEPSAWEKYYLGWIRPITVPPGEDVYPIPAVGLASEPDSVFRVPISAKEYFLVENRNRDANRDGATVTLERGGEIMQRTYFRDTTFFNAFNQDSIWGNVIDVDEFDWSLPGGVSSRTGEWFDGGLLIWHIDETVIDATLELDAVNANPDRRGVDLEEADGSQDIGQSYSITQAGFGSEDGTVLDFWYKGNSATPRLIENAFTPDSHPNSLSNDFANSHIYIRDFSPRGPRMSARIQLGDDQVKLIDGFPKPLDGPVQDRPLKIDGASDLIVSTGRAIFGWTPRGDPIAPFVGPKGIIVRTPAVPFGTFTITGNVAASDLNGDGISDLVYAANLYGGADTVSGILAALSLKDENADSLPDLLFSRQLGRELTTSPVIADSLIAVGAAGGVVYLLERDGAVTDSAQLNDADTSRIVGVSVLRQPDQFIAVSAAGVVSLVHRGVITGRLLQRNFSAPMSAPAVSGVISSSRGTMTALCTAGGQLYLLDASLSTAPGFPVATGADAGSAPLLADVDLDGSRDIVLLSGNRIWAVNAAGAPLDHFPATAPSPYPLLGSPVVADLDGNGTPDVVAVTQEGLIVAYDRTGSMVRGFPILGGVNAGSTPAAFAIPPPQGCLSCPIGIGLASASDDGHLYAWQTGSVSSMTSPGPLLSWPQYQRDAQNSGREEDQAPGSPVSEFFPASRAYNWPNPVRASDNYRTHIRYYVASDAKVVVKIFDLAGDLVTELRGDGIGGLDNEIEWDVSAIQSGIYFAHIDAQGQGGSGSSVIKIAVVK